MVGDESQDWEYKDERRTLLLGKVSLFTATPSREEEREQGSGKKDCFGKHFP